MNNKHELAPFEFDNDSEISEIRKAIKEADAGEFATEIEVAAVINKWKINLTKLPGHW